MIIFKKTLSKIKFFRNLCTCGPLARLRRLFVSHFSPIFAPLRAPDFPLGNTPWSYSQNHLIIYDPFTKETPRK